MTARTSAALQKPLIACVEDDVLAREALEGLLKAFGYTIEIFSSAEEFLQSDRLNEASCLITDVHMRGMSGLQLQSRLAASGSRIPVIVVTGFPDDRVRERALTAGAVGFLSKPFDTADLLTCIRSALDRRHADGKHL
jgi:FixJ family two-component response regulator